MINFRIEWMKLEDRCNMRSEINLLWCEESQEMWGINKYEITLSVSSSYGKRASFGKASLWWKCDPLWPSSGWEELANEILSIYQPLFENHTLAWTPGNQFTRKGKNKDLIQQLFSWVSIFWLHFQTMKDSLYVVVVTGLLWNDWNHKVLPQRVGAQLSVSIHDHKNLNEKVMCCSVIRQLWELTIAQQPTSEVSMLAGTLILIGTSCRKGEKLLLRLWVWWYRYSWTETRNWIWI